MSKNKKRYEFNQATINTETDEAPVEQEETEASNIVLAKYESNIPDVTLPDELQTLLDVAKEFNGKDHLSACSYYGVNRRECDCGVRRLWNAAMAVSEKWKI